MRYWSLLIALSASPILNAEVAPIWSSDVSETIPYASSYSTAGQTLTPAGAALMVAGEDRDGIAGSVLLEADGAISRGQFGHVPFAGGNLRMDAVLASSADRVLLRMIERDGPYNTPRSLTVMVDLAGTVQWVQARYAREARFLANGDVLLSSGNELLRVRGGDGNLVWLRNLLPLLPDAHEAFLVLPQTLDAPLLLGVRLAGRTPGGGETNPDPVIARLDPDTGATLWQVQRAASSALDFLACGNVALGSDSAFAWFESEMGQVDIVFERRASADGTLIWSTRVTNVDYGDGPCALLATGNTLALSTRDEQTTLVALGTDGALRWRQTLPVRPASKLLGAANGDLLLASPATLPGDVSGTLIQRRRAVDGALVWSFPVAGNAISWMRLGTELRIAYASIDRGAAVLNLQRHDESSGKLQSRVQAAAQGVALRPAQMKIIDGVPYGVMAGLGENARGVRVQRLDPLSGAAVWTSYLTLTADVGRLGSIEMSGLPQDGLAVVVAYRAPLPDSGVGHETILRIDRTSGALGWQQSQRASHSGAQTLGAPDGSVYANYGECLNPPACNQIENHLGRRAAADGSLQWSIPGSVVIQAVVGNDLLVRRTSAGNQFVLLDASNGAERWSQSLPASTASGAVTLATGDLVTRVSNASVRPRRIDIQRQLAVNGAPLWSAQPGAADDDLFNGALNVLANGDLLLSATFYGGEIDQDGLARPLLARIAADTGTLAWTRRPLAVGDRWRSLRILPGGSATQLWARSQRYVDNVNFQYEERYALATVALGDGAIGPEHLYARNYDAPLTSPGLIPTNIAGFLADGSVQVEQAAPDARGLWTPRLQRWPAPGAASGDIRLRRLGAPGIILGPAPSIQIDVEVENASASSVDSISTGFAGTDDDLSVILRSCQLINGQGSCPEQLDSSLAQTLALGPNAVMRLRYEVYDPDYSSSRSELANGSRGLFYADPPYAFGDSELGNNIVEIEVALGGPIPLRPAGKSLRTAPVNSPGVGSGRAPVTSIHPP
jgi:outer membrane protein assembly factor BamB